MRGILAFATISLGLLLATASLQAHHSFSATYDGNNEVNGRFQIAVCPK